MDHAKPAVRIGPHILCQDKAVTYLSLIENKEAHHCCIHCASLHEVSQPYHMVGYNVPVDMINKTHISHQPSL